MADQPDNRPAVPSATILLLRDSPEGVEVFMVVRHHQIDFASGALVFPGGKLDEADADPALRALCRYEGTLDEEGLALRVGAIREAFEEVGVLLARAKAPGAGWVLPTDIPQWEEYRTAVHGGQMDMMALLQATDLVLDLDCLVPYAHWITPDMMPRRYDTHFYLARCPSNYDARHDGGESVDSVWINPARALAEAEEGKWTIIFPTRMNLLKLSRAATVEEALATARTDPIVTVKPWVEEQDGQSILRIPEEAGYGVTWEPLERM